FITRYISMFVSKGIVLFYEIANYLPETNYFCLWLRLQKSGTISSERPHYRICKLKGKNKEVKDAYTKIKEIPG
ncbi:MAG: hypothetical protein ACUVWJ_12655, partial [Spirochaetota bacterium]